MIHSRISTSTSAGATIGTFDPLSTRNQNNTLPPGCTMIVGATYVASRIASTAALSKQTRLRLTHPSDADTERRFQLGERGASPG